jgi:hypothetical protein
MVSEKREQNIFLFIERNTVLTAAFYHTRNTAKRKILDNTTRA